MQNGENERTLLKESNFGYVSNDLEQIEGNPWSTLKGITTLFLCVFLTSVSQICVQALDRSVPDFELNSMRCGFAMVGMILYFTVTRTFPWVERKYLPPVLLLVVLNNAITIGLYVPVSLIPLATADSLMKTNFLVSGLIVFTLINQEKLRLDKLLSVPVCITGVFLVLQPSFILDSKMGWEMSQK